MSVERTGTPVVMAAPLVTIAVPVYTRFDYLEGALASVDAQQYANIELIVSTRAEDLERGRAMVDGAYGRAYRLLSEGDGPITAHWNKLVEEATGTFFTLLCDDDELSPGFVAELASRLEREPDADVALPRHELIDRADHTISRSDEPRPDRMDSLEFIRAWQSNELALHSMVTTLARTEAVRRVGGYPDFPRALHSDDALVIKLVVGKTVVLGQDSWFRWRVDQSSTGFSAPSSDAAQAVSMLRDFLDNDPVLQARAAEDPATWQKERRLLVRLSCSFYLGLWRTIYRERLSRLAWVRAAFALPFERWYYVRVAHTFLGGRAKWEDGSFPPRFD